MVCNWPTASVDAATETTFPATSRPRKSSPLLSNPNVLYTGSRITPSQKLHIHLSLRACTIELNFRCIPLGQPKRVIKRVAQNTSAGLLWKWCFVYKAKCKRRRMSSIFKHQLRMFIVIAPAYRERSGLSWRWQLLSVSHKGRGEQMKHQKQSCGLLDMP